MRGLPFLIYLMALTMAAIGTTAIGREAVPCALPQAKVEAAGSRDDGRALREAAIEKAAATRCLERLVGKYNKRFSKSEVEGLIEIIHQASGRFGLDPLLVGSVIAAESSFNPRARSRCGAEGLMQLTKPLQPWVGVSNPYDIGENIHGGCLYLAELTSRFDRLDLALAAYNAGPGRVARLGRVPEIQETIRYVRRVIRLYTEMTAEKRTYALAVERVVKRGPFVLI